MELDAATRDCWLAAMCLAGWIIDRAISRDNGSPHIINVITRMTDLFAESYSQSAVEAVVAEIAKIQDNTVCCCQYLECSFKPQSL